MSMMWLLMRRDDRAQAPTRAEPVSADAGDPPAADLPPATTARPDRAEAICSEE